MVNVWRDLALPITTLQAMHPPSEAPRGKQGFVRLAMVLMSVVPNSAATERLFSMFGIVHTKLRNRLHPEKARKQVLVRSDTAAKFGVIKRKRKFVSEDTNFAAAEPASPLADASSTAPSADKDGEEDENEEESLEFPDVAQLLMQDRAEDDASPPADRTSREEGSSSHRDAHLLDHLFFIPQADSAEGSSLRTLQEYWEAGRTGLQREFEYQEHINE